MKNEEIYDKIANKILELMAAGKSWRKTWTQGIPQSFVYKRAYTGVNFMLLSFAPYATPYYVTFQQAIKLGGNVRKGEKGWPIALWKRLEKVKANGDKEHFPMLRYYTVFNLEQCESIEIPKSASNDFKPLEVAEKIIANMPQRPEIRHAAGRCYYSPGKDFVSVPRLQDFDAPEAYYATMFHELAHSTGHSSRLHRFENGCANFFGDEKYSKEELVAELSAAFVCGTSGISNADTDENSAAYLASWYSKLSNDKPMLLNAIKDAQKAANFILTKPAPAAIVEEVNEA
jgi:antirestriction protein ArdC